ncbi:HIT domain-containing protein [bacterium]|nr:HIT domain-containing protein [bacterium]
MKECIFCQIGKHKIPAKIRYEDKEIIAFDDINPKAKIHILVVPKKHVASLNESDIELIKKLFAAIKTIVKKTNIADSGFKIVINTGKDGGQIIPHLHLHILGEEKVKHTP